MKVFVSYAREDKPLVDGVVRDLTDLRHDPYYDQNLLGGQKWWEELLDRISTSEVFMPCLFESYRESEACRREATYAADLGIPFLPVVGNEGQPPGTSYLRAITDANWVIWNAEERSSLARLASSLSSIGPVLPPTDPVERPPAPVDYRMIDLDEEVRGGQGMSRDRQLAIVSDLRRMRDRRDAPVARELLVRMRGRFDILADVRDDIDTVLAAWPETAATTAVATALTGGSAPVAPVTPTTTPERAPATQPATEQRPPQPTAPTIAPLVTPQVAAQVAPEPGPPIGQRPFPSASVPPPAPGGARAHATGNTLSIIGIICGVIAFLILPPLFGIAGLALGWAARKKGERLAGWALGVSACGLVLGMFISYAILSAGT